MTRRVARLLAPLILLVAVGRCALAEDAATVVIEKPILPEERSHWAYRPLADPRPPESAASGAVNPIDRFLRAKMAEHNVRPLPRAGKATLLRRIYFDLSGLPPSPNDVRRFLADDSPDAYEKEVDRLLASPSYGERYAQHWLDLARFAETDGFEHDLVRPNAWRYRDWVIDALNRDMPFDEFLSWQLAGDELHPGDPQAAIATGFLLCGPDMPDLNRQDERRHVVLNEMTSAVGSVFLGLQFGCAQCHDHKFDPIRQHDFYRLRAFFESSDIFADHPIPTAAELAALRAAEEAADPAERKARERQRELEDLGRQRARDKNPDALPTLSGALAELSKAERQEHRELASQLKKAKPLPALPLGRVVREGMTRESFVHIRGEFDRKGPAVDAGFPAVLDAVTRPSVSTSGPRARLAEWLTETDHPLVARVIVNRLWQWHFGEGLVASASDFGVMGHLPTHPELLDWLARRMMADGWSMKQMHRLLVTSEAYRAASSPYDRQWSVEETELARASWADAARTDPENRLAWHRRIMRLDGESIRDAMLAAGDRLSPRRGGPGIRPPLSAEVTSTLLKDQWVPNGDDEDHRRRSIYLFVRRNLRMPMFDVFDRPDTNASCPLRHQSTTATQSLVLLNSEFSLECAKSLAAAATRSNPGDRDGQLREVYLRTFSRPIADDELQLGLKFLNDERGRDEPAEFASLVKYCLVVLNASEFIYLD